ncbi:HEAT repeat domain-containing protein [Legionella micdadei]|uniref:HEAT repeat domain-containing protein n=1 Tax=Legionella micdadei TaxID=451 RepID=UPI0009EF7551|nr:hypothetical protein [Legionella micdadei]ARH01043.1 hypothetical protein B6V88_11830 [Legionella micdadei]
MTKTDFFSPLPQEVLVRIYSNLGLKELLCAWHTGGKIQQRAIEDVLFKKNEIEFYSSQIQILTILSNVRSIFNGDDNYLHALGKKFAAKMKNPQLTLADRLRGLKLIGAIWHVHPDITLIVSKLYDQDPGVCQASLNSLAAIVPALEEKALAALVEPVINKLSDPNWKVHQAALNCLTAIAPVLKKETLRTLAEPVTNKLNDQNGDVRYSALTCLAVIVPTLEKETLIALIEPIKNNLNDPNPDVCQAALNCLDAMAPALEKERLATLVEPVKNKLNDQDLFVRSKALNCLAAMIPSLEKETRATFVELVTNKLNDKNLHVRQTACHFLVFLLANPENDLKIEIDSASLNTSESLLIHVVSDWINQIHKVSIQAEVAMQQEENPLINRL